MFKKKMSLYAANTIEDLKQFKEEEEHRYKRRKWRVLFYLFPSLLSLIPEEYLSSNGLGWLFTFIEVFILINAIVVFIMDGESIANIVGGICHFTLCIPLFGLFLVILAFPVSLVCCVALPIIPGLYGLIQSRNLLKDVDLLIISSERQAIAEAEHEEQMIQRLAKAIKESISVEK